MQSAAKAYGKVAHQIATSRELEANLLLRAAAQLQAVRDEWNQNSGGLHEALRFNRMLWSILVTEVVGAGNQLPEDVRRNVGNLGIFVMKQTVAATGAPHPDKLGSLININRELATGLLANG